MYVFRSQFVSQCQDAGVFDLLKFRIIPALVGEISIDIDIWTLGRVRRLYRQQFHQIASNLEGKQFNQIVDKSLREPFIWRTWGEVKMYSLIIDIGPSNRLWGSVEGYVAPSRVQERARKTFASRAEHFRFHGISKIPSVLDETAFLEPADSTTVSGIFREIFELLSHVDVPPGLIGFIDLADPTERVLGENLQGTFGSNPRSYELLGNKIDDVHNVIIGSQNLCEGLARSIGEGSKCLSLGSNGATWLEIDATALRDRKKLLQQVGSWLLSP